MARIKLTIAYLGTGFAGWQLQAVNAGPPLRTVQGELESALAALLGRQVRVHASGRTDAGVHADEQVVHFDAPDGTERYNWQQALHTRLPPDLSVLSAERVSDGFHARYDCQGKIYSYGLWLRLDYTPPKLRQFAWAVGRLDLERMERAAALLPGEHDFAGFQNVGTPVEDTVRTLYSVDGRFVPLPGEQSPGADPLYMIWRFHGNGFLKQMVRNLMGFLVQVGRCKLRPEDALTLFANRDRTALNFPTAPAWGLTLTRVLY